jgi:hypothetical protein
VIAESAGLDQALASFKSALAAHRSYVRETDPPTV